MNSQTLYPDKDKSYYSLGRHELLALVPPNTKRLLDVGCGGGYTGATAKKLFGLKEVVGIELFQSAADSAKTKLDRVITGDIEDLNLDFPEGYFDCILCADVLEHTKNPWEVLRKLYGYLDDEGVLIASIPNIRHIVPILKILFDRFEYEESGILDKTHLRFFTLHTMKQMFEENGYRITRIESNRSSSWKFWLLNLFSIGLMRQLSIYQYVIVAQKKLT